MQMGVDDWECQHGELTKAIAQRSGCAGFRASVHSMTREMDTQVLISYSRQSLSRNETPYLRDMNSESRRCYPQTARLSKVSRSAKRRCSAEAASNFGTSVRAKSVIVDWETRIL